MSGDALSWLAAACTVGLLMAYELAAAWAQRLHPDRVARTAHVRLREDWFQAVSAQPGSEILAVQTLRNSVMSASVSASTAVLGLIGSATLAAPGLRASFDAAEPAWPLLTPRLVLQLLLRALLRGSMVASVMAVRYFTHASYVGAMPVGSAARGRWSDTGRSHVRRAGLLYSWGLRQLVLIAPLLASILHPLAGPVAALVMVIALATLDRTRPAH